MSAVVTAQRIPESLFDAIDVDRVDDSGEQFSARQAQLDTLFEANGGEPRLDDVIARLWEGLAAHRLVECPVCGDEMHPEYGAHALPIAGRCGTCGSTLS